MFTNLGRVYCKKVYEIPSASRTARGNPIVGLLNLREGETVQTVLPVDNFEGARHVVFATAKGIVKKTPLQAFSNPRSNGIIAIDLDDDDRLINADVMQGGTVLLFSNRGKVLRFAADALRPLSRTARGVASINFKDGEDGHVVSMLAVSDEEAKNRAILIAADNGRGKRTNAAEFPVKGRRGYGVIAMQLKSKNKDAVVVGATLAEDKDDLMLITDGGVLVRTNMNEIRKQGRNTQGFSLIRLDAGRRLVGLARIAEENDEE